MSRVSFFDKTKTFMRALPPSTPATVKLVALAFFTYAGADDGGNIYASIKTISEQCGESERTVERAVTFMRKNGWLADEGMMDHGNGAPTKLRRLVLEKIIADRAAELGSDADTVLGGYVENRPDISGMKGPSEVTQRPVRNVGSHNIEEPPREPPRKNLPDSLSRNREKTESLFGAEQPKPPRACRLPDDWIPTPKDQAFADNLSLDGPKVFDQFVDYWRAQPGQKGVKADWSATWRNWCRNSAERKQHLKPSSSGGYQFSTLNTSL